MAINLTVVQQYQFSIGQTETKHIAITIGITET